MTTHAATEVNRANLADSFLEEVRARYAGTRLGRQELDGVLLADAEGALWTTKMMEKCRADTLSIRKPQRRSGQSCIPRRRSVQLHLLLT